MLVAATNPCPCGYAGVGDRCTCTEPDLRRHQRRLSGPLLDRMDLLVGVVRPSDPELRGRAQIDSASARERVAEARARQLARLRGTHASCNGELDARLARAHIALDDRAERSLGRAYAAGALSARGRHRILRVARTIADLEGHDRVTEPDLLLALSLRQRAGWEGALAV
jgi:magnesium chelatase family protein